MKLPSFPSRRLCCKSVPLAIIALTTAFICCSKNGQTNYRKATDSIFRKPDVNPDRIFGDMLGINAFEWNFGNQHRPLERAPQFLAFSGVRHYLDWRQIEPDSGKYGYNPTPRGGWNYDQIYQWCAANNITVLACLKTVPDWLLETFPPEKRDAENAPAPYGADLSDPSSYRAFAELGFQFAARYGNNKHVDPSLVHVAPVPHYNPNRKKIGLGTIRYIECNNEPNRTWKPSKVAYQNAEQYAANLSAFYDGHKGSMGSGVGVKNADSTLQVVMGGITPGDTQFVADMIEWCRKHRGIKDDGSVDLCFDVINYHSYAHNRHIEKNKSRQRGKAPEITRTQEIAEQFVDFRAKNGLDLEIWVTEFGYDVNEKSIQRAIRIGEKSAEITQADWNLRAALMYSRVGIDRIFYYMLHDVAKSSATQYASSGFIDKEIKGGKRPTWYYFYQTKRLLGDFQFDSTLHSDPIVDRYVLGDRVIYVLTVPDETGRTAEFELEVGSGIDSVEIHELVVGQDSMNTSTKTVVNGKVKLTVTETPIFVETRKTNANQ